MLEQFWSQNRFFTMHIHKTCWLDGCWPKCLCKTCMHFSSKVDWADIWKLMPETHSPEVAIYISHCCCHLCHHDKTSCLLSNCTSFCRCCTSEQCGKSSISSRCFACCDAGPAGPAAPCCWPMPTCVACSCSMLSLACWMNCSNSSSLDVYGVLMPAARYTTRLCS